MKQKIGAILGIISYMVLLVGMNVYHKTYPVSSMTDEIEQQLVEYIKTNRLDPVEPRIDSVWDFVPGLVGAQIDYELSYNNMLLNGSFDPSLIVAQKINYKQDPEQFRDHPIYKGNESGQYASLLINVAWGEEELEKMLTILEKLNVRATFFFEGRYAENHKEQVLKIHSAGHQIGNHSYSHPANWGTFTYDQYVDEIKKTNEILSSIINEPIIYFAPPAGEFNDLTLKAAYDQGMYSIMWTADTIDWKGGNADVLISRVMKKLEPGALILMHPKPETVLALESMINQIKEKGYQFKTIDEIVQGTRPECSE
ncbi:MAG: polysaccharide deacetylase family protein [Turicibacter sp.]|nr:polysaccharide deacetylase family protein [Turicibacter sp.]